MNLEPGDHRCRLTPQVAKQLGVAIQGGLLSRLEIRETKPRRWTVEYTVSPHSLATAANFENRVQAMRDLNYLAAALDRKVLKKLDAALGRDLRLIYQYVVEVPSSLNEEEIRDA